MMMKRFAGSVILATVIGLSGTAHAMNWGSFQGNPQCKASEEYGYCVWHDDKGVHVRWTTIKNEHIFSGSIQTDGTIDKVRGFQLEGADWIKKDSPKSITWSTTTKQGLDGIDFRRDGGTSITFLLKVDDKLIPTKFIWVGSGDVNPPENPFSVKTKK